MGDIDILIHHGDLEKAIRLLEDTGYNEVKRESHVIEFAHSY